MLVLRLDHIHKSFPSAANATLLDVSIEIHGPSSENPGSHMGLVGGNGAGKTTLLRIITGGVGPDSGTVTIPPGTGLGYLEQEAAFTGGRSVLEEALQGRPDLMRERDALESMEAELCLHSPSELLDRYGEAQQRFERAGGYEHEDRARTILETLGFTTDALARSTSTLSGGEKTRLGMCKLLVRSPDLLLLDEPTNHVDLEAIRWLERYLSSYAGAFIVVSHDRAFLDAVCTSIAEIRDATITLYPGGYSSYRALRGAEEERARRICDEQIRRVRLLKREFARRKIWSDRKEREKLGGPGDTGYIGHRAAKMMKRALAARRRMEGTTPRGHGARGDPHRLHGPDRGSHEARYLFDPGG